MRAFLRSYFMSNNSALIRHIPFYQICKVTWITPFIRAAVMINLSPFACVFSLKLQSISKSYQNIQTSVCHMNELAFQILRFERHIVKNFDPKSASSQPKFGRYSIRNQPNLSHSFLAKEYCVHSCPSFHYNFRNSALIKVISI